VGRLTNKKECKNLQDEVLHKLTETVKLS
jgi:hypothetical protein